MKKGSFLLFLVVSISVSLSAQKLNKITLPDGWVLLPAGHGYLLGDLPLDIKIYHKKEQAGTNVYAGFGR